MIQELNSTTHSCTFCFTQFVKELQIFIVWIYGFKFLNVQLKTAKFSAKWIYNWCAIISGKIPVFNLYKLWRSKHHICLMSESWQLWCNGEHLGFKTWRWNLKVAGSNPDGGDIFSERYLQRCKEIYIPPDFLI